MGDRARGVFAHDTIAVSRKSSINGESGRKAVSSQLTGSGSDETTAGEYGANEWLVDEMYEKYLADPESVDKTWWPVLEHYRQVQTTAAETARCSQSGS